MREPPRFTRIPEEIRAFVNEQKLGFVATVSPDGSPNVSPKGTLAVWDEERLVFADLASPGTIRNLERDGRVEVNVVDPIVRKGWRFKGEAEVLHAGSRFDAGVRFFAQLDVLDAPKRIRSIVLIRVRAIAPLVSPAYSTGHTEAEIRADAWARYERRYGSAGLRRD